MCPPGTKTNVTGMLFTVAEQVVGARLIEYLKAGDIHFSGPEKKRAHVTDSFRI